MADKRTKRIAKNTFVLFLRMLLITVIGLYTSRLILQILGVEDFGIFNLVGGIIVMMGFVSGSMTLAVNRFFAYELGKGDLEGARNVFSMAINIYAVLSVVILFAGETLGLWFVNTQLSIPAERLLAANVVYQASIVSFLLQMIQIPFNSTFIANEDMDVYAYISVFETLARLGILYIVHVISYDSLSIYAVLYVGVALVVFFLNVGFALGRYRESRYRLFWSKKIFIDITKYVSYSTYGSLATVVVTQGQSILLNIFYGPVLNAVRGISLQVTSAVMKFVQNVYVALTPQITKSYAQKDRAYFLNLIVYSSVLTYYLLFLISLPLILGIDLVLELWLVEVPEYTNIFVRLILINSVLSNITMPSQIALYSTGNVTKLNIYTGTVNIMGVVITYVIWKIINTEPYVIVYIQIFFTLIVQIINVYLQKAQLDIPILFFFRKVLKPILLVTFTSSLLPIIIYLNIDENIGSFFLVSAISVVISLLSIYVFGIDKEMKEIFTYRVMEWFNLK